MSLSISQAFKTAWHAYKSNWKIFIPVYVVFIVVSILMNYGQGPKGNSEIAHPFIFAISMVLWLIITIGVQKLALKLVDAEDGSAHDLVAHYRLFFKYIFTSILRSLAVGVFIIAALIASVGVAIFKTKGTTDFSAITQDLGAAVVVGIILGLAAIYVALRLMFSEMSVVDRAHGPIDALKTSWRITRGHVLDILALGILIGLMVIISIFTIVGLLITIPLALLVMASAYRQLAGK